MDENCILTEDLYECNEVNNLHNEDPSEKLESPLSKFPKEKSTVKDKKPCDFLNHSAHEQSNNFQGTSLSSTVSLGRDLPDELLNIGPSEKLMKRLRQSNSQKKILLETSLPEELCNVGPSEKLQRLRGPTPQSKPIFKSSLPGKLQNLRPSEKLKRLCDPKKIKGSLGIGLPTKLRNIGPSEKLKKLRGPSTPNRSLLNKRLPSEQINSVTNKTFTRLQETDRKPIGNFEKPHQIFQKRLQAIMKKPQAIIKKIEPEVLKPNQLAKSTPAEIQHIEFEHVGNSLNDCQEDENPILFLKDQILPVNSNKTFILDLKGSSKLIVKGRGEKLIGPNKKSKFVKLPLNVYNELKNVFEDTHSLDNKKTEDILKNLGQGQIRNRQNDEVDGLKLVMKKVADSEPEYTEEETLLEATQTSQYSNNYCDDAKEYILASNYDAPQVKLNSKQTISISRPQNNNLRNELIEINEFRRKIFPKTYKRSMKGKFLFGLRNKVDSKNAITGLGASQFLSNQISTELLEPINLEAGEWHKLYTPSDTRIPVGSIIAPMIHRLRERLPTLTGRDKLEVSFLLSMMSSFPNMPKEIKELMYQRLNLVYMAVMFSWKTALTLAQTSEGMSIKSNTTSENWMNVRLKSNSHIHNPNNENLTNPANGSINNCSNISRTPEDDNNTFLPIKPQYHFQILIKEKTSPTGTSSES